jgi:DNA-directed RNA polymerase specialized sigma24 family protein
MGGFLAFRREQEMAGDQDSECASDAKVRSAIAALGAQKLRLLRWGQILFWTYGKFAEHRQPEDLYMEAITRTLGRDRKWDPKNCSFAEHLMGAMKSIASHWPEKYSKDMRNVPLRGSDLPVPNVGDDDFVDPLENVTGDTPTPEEELVAKQALDRIEKLIEDDEEAFGVLVLLAQRKTEPEIAEERNLPRKIVHAAIERIRYKILKAAK